MKKTCLSFLALLLCCSCFAQTLKTFKVNLTADAQAYIEAYLPVHPSGRAIVDCPGGGYGMLAKAHEGHDWATYFNKQGIAYFVLTYRMPHGDRNVPMSDATSAMRMVRDSSRVWHINPYDVGIMGFSAGGHLASTIATHSDFSARPNFQILVYPVISMESRGTHQGSVNNFLGNQKNDRQLVREYSNYNKVKRHVTPPAAIFLAGDDNLVPPLTNGIEYYKSLISNNVPAALYCYPTGGHGFGFRENYQYHSQMLNELTEWLNSLKAPKADAKRVACIGNSITDGSGINMSDLYGYPARLQEILGSDFYVKNFGVSARTMLNKGDFPYMKEQAWLDALEFNPDIAIIKLGTNDSKDLNWKYGKEFKQDMQEMIDRLKSLPSKPVIYLATPIPAYKPSWTINDSVIVNGIIPVIKQLAKKNKLKVIDMHTMMAGDEKLIQRDGIHPNEQGAAKMAKIIGNVLKP